MSLWKKMFGGKAQPEELDPLRDLSLSKLKVGYLLDYDLKTWEVTSYATYTFDGAKAEEWRLDAGDTACFLEREEDDGVEWSVSHKIDFAALGGRVRDHVQRHDDPPDEIEYEGVRYRLQESGAGHYHPDGRVGGDEMIYWDYTDADDDRFLTIEQWGEDEFEAAVGRGVHEYEFTNILPRSSSS